MIIVSNIINKLYHARSYDLKTIMTTKVLIFVKQNYELIELSLRENKRPRKVKIITNKSEYKGNIEGTKD